MKYTHIHEAKRDCAMRKQELDATYERYLEALRDVPINFQNDVHRYMAVRIAGFIEKIFHRSLTAYIYDSSSPQVARFALHNNFIYAPNLNPKTLDKLIEKFGEPLEEPLKLFLEEHQRRTVLGQLYGIRNDAAHGEGLKGGSLNVKGFKDLGDDLYIWIASHVLA